MAFSFDEVNDYIKVNANSALDLPDGDWTISVWVRLPSNAGTDLKYILNSDSDSSNPSLHWYIVEASHASTTVRNDIQFLIRDASGDAVSGTSSPGPFTSTDWTHIALSRSSSTITMYVAGSSVDSDTDASFDGLTMSSGMWIGVPSDLNVNRYFGGTMAELAKWDRALSTGELQALSVGFSPKFFLKDLKYHLPMIREYRDIKSGLTITNNGTTVAAHPRIIYPIGGGFTPETNPVLISTIEASGIESTTDYGVPSLVLNISGSGVASTSVFGLPSLVTDDTVSLLGLASTTAFGTAVIERDATIEASGIPSISAFGTSSVINAQTLVLTGLSLTSAFGTHIVSPIQTIVLSGIPSQSSIGSQAVNNTQIIVLEGIPSVTVLGEHVIVDLGFSRVTPTEGDFTLVPF